MFTDKTRKSIQTFPLIYFTCTSTDVWTDKGRTRHALIKGFTQQKCLTIIPQQLYYIVYV